MDALFPLLTLQFAPLLQEFLAASLDDFVRCAKFLRGHLNASSQCVQVLAFCCCTYFKILLCLTVFSSLVNFPQFERLSHATCICNNLMSRAQVNLCRMRCGLKGLLFVSLHVGQLLQLKGQIRLVPTKIGIKTHAMLARSQLLNVLLGCLHGFMA